MVFYIENTEQSVFDLDYEIKAFRNEHKKITPEFAKNILSICYPLYFFGNLGSVFTNKSTRFFETS